MINFREWRTEAWISPVNENEWTGAKFGLIDTPDVAGKTLGDVDCGSLFVYMFRRFGPSVWGSDPRKEIASWYLTTPDPNAGLWVSPRPSGSHFGYTVRKDWFGDEYRNPAKKAELSYLVSLAMLDLLRPVYVRDVAINAMGKMEENRKLFKAKEAARFEWAGYGVVREYFEDRFGGE